MEERALFLRGLQCILCVTLCHKKFYSRTNTESHREAQSCTELFLVVIIDILPHDRESFPDLFFFWV